MKIQSLDSRSMLFMAYMTLKKFLNLSRLQVSLAPDSLWAFLTVFEEEAKIARLGY